MIPYNQIFSTVISLASLGCATALTIAGHSVEAGICFGLAGGVVGKYGLDKIVK